MTPLCKSSIVSGEDVPFHHNLGPRTLQHSIRGHQLKELYKYLEKIVMMNFFHVFRNSLSNVKQPIKISEIFQNT